MANIRVLDRIRAVSVRAQAQRAAASGMRPLSFATLFSIVVAVMQTPPVQADDPAGAIARLTSARRGELTNAFRTLDGLQREAAELLKKRNADGLAKLGDTILDTMEKRGPFAQFQTEPAEVAAHKILQPCDQTYAYLSMLLLNADGVLRKEKDAETQPLNMTAEQYRSNFSRCAAALSPGTAPAISMDEIARINSEFAAAQKR